MHLALRGPTLTPTPLPTIGRSWSSWSYRNSWCSGCPGEYCPLSLALQALAPAPSLPCGSGV